MMESEKSVIIIAYPPTVISAGISVVSYIDPGLNILDYLYSQDSKDGLKYELLYFQDSSSA